jgi:cytochrome c-type biogenesis protein CcmH
MRRNLKPFAAVLAILALVFGLAYVFTAGGTPKPTQASLESALVCTTCHEPLDESSSPLAQQMKKQIREQIAAGRTTAQIKAYFVDELGPQVLAVPKSSGFDLLAWLLPFAAIIFGAAAVGFAASAWLKNRDDADGGPSAPDGPKLAPNLELRVDQELATFDT